MLALLCFFHVSSAQLSSDYTYRLFFADTSVLEFMNDARKIGKKGDITLRIGICGEVSAQLGSERGGLQVASLEDLKALVEQVGAAKQYKNILNIG